MAGVAAPTLRSVNIQAGGGWAGGGAGPGWYTMVPTPAEVP